MAVYQGARLRPAALPARSTRRGRVDPSALARGAGARPAGVLMGIILALTMLALVYLTQTLGSSAAQADLGKLQLERAKLGRILFNQAAVARMESDPVKVMQRARDADLSPLGDPIVLPTP